MLIYLEALDTLEEKSKFEVLYLEYRSLMFHVANEILQNEQDAEDAVHQAFLTIAENIRKVGEPGSPKTKGYVITIAENKAIDQYRQRKRRQTVELSDTIEGVHAVYDGDNTLAACILKLPARYREVILLRYFQGYSVKELAAMTGLSFFAASKLDQRAKNKLKGLYEKENR